VNNQSPAAMVYRAVLEGRWALKLARRAPLRRTAKAHPELSPKGKRRYRHLPRSAGAADHG
jgi:hypothetical protein